MCYRPRAVAFLFLPALLICDAGWSATITKVLPLTDRILMVHFDDGQVNHSKAGQAWGQETVVVSPLNASAASATNSYLVTGTNDASFATGLRPTKVEQRPWRFLPPTTTGCSA